MACSRAGGAENRLIWARHAHVRPGQPGRLALGKCVVDAHVVKLGCTVLHVCVDYTDFLDGTLLVAVHHDGVVSRHPDDAA